VAVEVLACAVVAHGGARVGVPGSDLDVAQIHSGVEHRGHERVPQHVRVGAGDAHAASLPEVPKAARAACWQ
jgi:hypothetical protein